MSLRKIFIIGLLATASCSKNSDPGSLFGNFDQTAMLTNVGSNILLPAIHEFSSSAAKTAIVAFTANPSDSTLLAAQTAWATIAQNWGSVAPFNFGPLNDNLISSNIDTWPANVNKIEAAITAQSNAANLGADTKGMKCLEYLLFDKIGNGAVLAKYTGNNSSDRIAFLNSVINDLSTHSTDLENAWNNGYLDSFANAQGNDVSSSVSVLVNAICLYLDFVKNTKIGNPIGVGIKVNDNKAHPELIEYLLAEQSLAVMKLNLQTMKEAFNGGTGKGLDDILDYMKAQKNAQNLSTVINNQFDDAIIKISLINSPYATALTDQRQQIQDVFNSLKILIAYFKVDVANNLGVTITFTDTDGD